MRNACSRSLTSFQHVGLMMILVVVVVEYEAFVLICQSDGLQVIRVMILEGGRAVSGQAMVPHACHVQLPQVLGMGKSRASEPRVLRLGVRVIWVAVPQGAVA